MKKKCLLWSLIVFWGHFSESPMLRAHPGRDMQRVFDMRARRLIEGTDFNKCWGRRVPSSPFSHPRPGVL